MFGRRRTDARAGRAALRISMPSARATSGTRTTSAIATLRRSHGGAAAGGGGVDFAPRSRKSVATAGVQGSCFQALRRRSIRNGTTSAFGALQSPATNSSCSSNFRFSSQKAGTDFDAALAIHSLSRIRLVTSRWVHPNLVRLAQIIDNELDPSGSRADCHSSCHQLIFPRQS
jgi:hypothetical protein